MRTCVEGRTLDSKTITILGAAGDNDDKEKTVDSCEGENDCCEGKDVELDIKCHKDKVLVIDDGEEKEEKERKWVYGETDESEGEEKVMMKKKKLGQNYLDHYSYLHHFAVILILGIHLAMSLNWLWIHWIMDRN